MLPLIISMSLPAIFSMLVQALYNVVDSVYVSHINENALTAVSLALPVQNLMIAVAVGTGVGVNSLISRRLGEGKREEASQAATHSVLLGLFSWLVFAVFGLFFAEAFFRSFTSLEEIVRMGTQYTSVVTIFSVGVFVEVNMEKTLQGTGNMIYPMLFQLTGCVANIILDPIFIFGYFGVPAMGVTGAAVATVIGQLLAMAFSIYIVFTKNHEVKVTFRGFRFSWSSVRNIYSVGFPSIIMQSISSVLVVALNGLLITFSETAVAVLGVYFKLQSFVFMPVFGLNQGLMPIMGYNYGTRNRRRLREALRLGCLISFLIMLAGMAVFWAFPQALLGFFQASDQMLAMGVPALRLISLSFVMAAFGIIFSTLFQAVGIGILSLIVSALRQLVIILPLAWALSRLGLLYIWAAFPLAEIAALAVSSLMVRWLFVHRLNFSQEPGSRPPA